MPDHRTETQKLTDSLREAILGGEYTPGERLPQRKVADRFNTTPIVAREALRALASEKLLIIEPRIGAMVEEITAEKLIERYIVREALEGMAARLACEKMSRLGERELIELADRCDSVLYGSQFSLSEKAKIHMSLHEKIIKLADCEELSNILSTIYLKSIIVSNAYHIDWKTEEKGWHRKLIDAIVSDDPDEAERTMRDHVINGRNREIQALNTSKNHYN